MNVIFDIGNVLVDFNIESFYQKVTSRLPCPYGKEFAINAFSKSFKKVEQLNYCGFASLEDAVVDALKLSGVTFTSTAVHSILKAWNESVIVNEQMVTFIKKVKDVGIKVAYLSNMGYEHFNYLKDSELFSLADELHISCEVGIAKPKNLFYQSFLMDHGEFNGALYLDDKVENVRAASSYKLKGIVFDLSKEDQLSLKKSLDSTMELLLSR